MKNFFERNEKWLVFYNLILTTAWLIVLINTIILYALVGQPHLFIKTHFFNTIVQCLSIIEIFNVMVKIVKTSLIPTLIQVFSRIFIVICVWTFLPNSLANYELPYFTLCLSWSITEVIRYSYYLKKIMFGQVNYWHTWLRYSSFIVLYISGVTSELITISSSLQNAKKVFNNQFYYFLKLLLILYGPGFVYLYCFMIKQRHKVLKRYIDTRNPNKKNI